MSEEYYGRVGPLMLWRYMYRCRQVGLQGVECAMHQQVCNGAAEAGYIMHAGPYGNTLYTVGPTKNIPGPKCYT